ncbi:MAG: tetratricopeptide repeat protein, partial [Candidatus Omnitrophica bacterium]|nr:tetratricopeptide repeat protein [Candidatus Omnitrophota bacterium]
SSSELLGRAWEAHGQYDTENTFKYTQQCIDLYKEQAQAQQRALTSLPKNKQEIEAVQILNDVANCYFIQGESYMRQEKFEDAIKVFQLIIDNYPYAQGWDPRGWFWVIAKASQDSIDKMQGKVKETEGEKKRQHLLSTKVVLNDPGSEDFINYEKYGEFKNIGTKDYKYVIKDQAGLSRAAGEGVYPNTGSVRKDPALKKAIKDGRLAIDQWELLNSQDLEAAFLKWATCNEPVATRHYYVALILERAGLIKQAIKAYYAIVVHFPYANGWTYWHTPWYLAQSAIGRIHYLLRKHPELGYKLEGASVRIINGFDNDITNDIVITNPGKFVPLINKKSSLREKIKAKITSILARRIKKVIGQGRVQLVQFVNGDWQLRVDKKPFVIKGVTYTATKVGESPDNKTLQNWMTQDTNKNGLIDGPYEAFVDKNRNNLQDIDEPAVGDFRLMKDMGINVIRIYKQPFEINKKLLLDLYKKYGIMVILGDFLGKYALGSGASWYEGTDYTNPEHKKKMLESVIQMVTEFKDEPYILFWLLGNENVYGVACNADKNPKAFFIFASEVAREIKKIDKNHPVAVASGDVVALDKFAEYAKDVDIFGSNVYRGESFGYFWQQVKDETDKPAFITEYGCPAYVAGMSEEEAEIAQAEYLKNNWEDIKDNLAFGPGAGNALGGVLYEWMDEWWKAYEPARHDTKGLFAGPFPGGYMYEEWLGIIGQGNGKRSPFLRQLRKSYFTYKELWR